jgi:hypothetical protein
MDEESIVAGIHARMGTPRAELEPLNPERSIRDAINMAVSATTEE